MLISAKESLTFDDVLLVPQYSTVSSRSAVDMSVDLPKGFRVNSPFVPANMKDVVGFRSAVTFYDKGCLVLLHRFGDDPVNDQIKILKCLIAARQPGATGIGCSIGTKEPGMLAAQQLVEAGFKIICVDVAHGDSKAAIDIIKFVSKIYPDVLLIAGNVATSEGARRLWTAGADIVKVGIGPGSICTTRKETGNGVPQMTALENIHNSRLEYGRFIGRPLGIIADGGIRSSGDCVKALCFADLVMIGGLFAATVESPGKTSADTKFKEYRGSSTHKSSRIEGTVLLKPVAGKLADVIDQLTEGVQSGCSYQNAHKVSDLKEDPVFVRVTTGQQNLDQNKETHRG